MPSLDVFKGDAFTMSELTASINRAPYQPGRIGAMGIFEEQGIRTITFQLERKGNTIELLPSGPRGAEGTQHKRSKRNVRIFNVPHIPHDDQILADEIQNIRAFGSETELQAVASEVTDRLDSMRQNHEITHEYYRAGAIQGVVKDGDGSTTLVNLFTEFGIAQKAVDFVLGTSTTNIKGKCEEVQRHMEDSLGAMTYSGIHALVGNTFWDSFIKHAEVKAAFERWLGNGGQGAFLRDTQRNTPGGSNGFEFAGITWENYRGKVGDVSFIPDTDCRFIPMGVRGLFLTRYAPADFVETVNQKGQAVYAKQELMRFGKGIDLHTQSNPLMICSIPEALVRGHTSN